MTLSKSEYTERLSPVQPLRVALSDPDPLAREGIHMLLNDDQHISIVGVTPDIETLLSMLAEPDQSVEAVLIDMHLLERDDFSPLLTLRRTYPQYRIVALGTAAQADLLLKVFRLGVSGYVLKSGSISQFRAALHEVLIRNCPVLPEMAQQLLGHVIQETAATREDFPVASLSRREREVLSYLTKGMSNKEIAEKLQVTNRTVKAHVSKILLKMGVADRTQAVVKALSTKNSRWIV